MKTKKIIETILATTLSVASLIQLIPIEYTKSIFSNVYIIIFICICAIILIILLIIDLCEVIHTTHHFKKGSWRFVRFFSRWYSKPGKLTLICDDLNWTTVSFNKKQPILDALKKKSKSNELVVYINSIKKTSSDILNELPKAIIKENHQGIISKYSFSCLSYIGNNSAVIIRDKADDKNETIVFQEISDARITNLLNALLEG